MTPEQKQRIGQIRQRHLRVDCYKSQMRADIAELLSLVKSQEAAAGVSMRSALLGVQNKMGCWCVTPFVNISEDRDHEPRCKAVFTALREPDAATSMRSACVEKVKALGQQWYAEAKKRGAAFSDKGRLAELIAKELESVSIQEQKR